MGRPKDLSSEKKGEIKALIELGNLSQRQIATKTGVSKTSVANVIQKLKTDKTLTSKRTGHCGRKRIMTPRGIRKLTQIIKNNRTINNENIKTMLCEAGVTVSSRTVRRRLKELKYNSCRPARKPALTENMKKKRLAWAKKYKNFTVEDWRKVRNTLNVLNKICYKICVRF